MGIGEAIPQATAERWRERGLIGSVPLQSGVRHVRVKELATLRRSRRWDCGMSGDLKLRCDGIFEPLLNRPAGPVSW